MQPFQIVVRALPSRDLPTQAVTLGGRDTTTLLVPADEQAGPLGVSFEQAVAALEAFSRMHVEPDGSFVWVSSNDEVPWQVDGNLYDRDGSLIAIDLKGTCDATQLVRLADVFRSAGRELMIELVRDATFVREREFLRLLK